MAVWPVGVDTEEFYPSSVTRNNQSVMVYHKERDLQELVYILETVHSLGLHCTLVIYDRYTELEFKEALAKTNFIIWHGPHESQGLALQEAMACNVPILVCDATSLLQAKSSKYRFPSELAKFLVTSIPYFDVTCGIHITELSQLANAIQEMLARRESFQPREYILKNLSLERQARAFIGLWEQWGLSWDDGFRERVYSSKPFSIPVSNRFWNLAFKVKSYLETRDAS
jgi:glycosyltransferase involved in cell wall biosynthesis